MSSESQRRERLPWDRQKDNMEDRRRLTRVKAPVEARVPEEAAEQRKGCLRSDYFDFLDKTVLCCTFLLHKAIDIMVAQRKVVALVSVDKLLDKLTDYNDIFSCLIP